MGNIYSTDIKAYINNCNVKAYNIGGRTCVPIEDVTQAYSYDDANRVLLIESFAPDKLIKYTGSSSKTANGTIVGSIYSTDIKTYVYNTELPAYNIGGKTCVAIEDLGADSSFSNIGGKYLWDSSARTIKLKFMYDNEEDAVAVLNRYKYNMKIVGRIDPSTFIEGAVTFDSTTTEAVILADYSALIDSNNQYIKSLIPLVFWKGDQQYGEDVGYHFTCVGLRFVNDQNGVASLQEMPIDITYYLVDKIEANLNVLGN